MEVVPFSKPFFILAWLIFCPLFLVGLSDLSEKIKDVFSVVLPVIDSPQFLTWLMREVCSRHQVKPWSLF